MLKKDLGFTFAGQLAYVIFATLANGLLARGLGPEARGLFALVIWMPVTLSMFAPFGQAQVNGTFAGLHKGKREQLLFQSILITLLFSALFMAAFFVWFFWRPFPLGKFANVPPRLILLAAWIIPVMALDTMLRELALGSQRIRPSTLIVTLGFFLQALGYGLVIFFWRGGVEGALWIYLAYQVVIISGNLFLLRQYWRWPQWDGALFRESLKLGFIYMLSRGFGFMVHTSLIFMLGYMDVTEAAIGLFAVAMSFSRQMGMIPTSVTQAFLPRISNDPEKRLQETPRVFRLTLVASFFCMAAFLFPGSLVLLALVGWDYLGSIPVIAAMLPGLTLFAGARMLGLYLWVLKKPHYSMVNNLLGLGALVGLCLILVPPLGIVGAGLAYSLALLLLSALTFWAFQRESRTPFPELIPGKAEWTLFFRETGQGVRKVAAWRKKA